jgi:hypothetical protein
MAARVEAQPAHRDELGVIVLDGEVPGAARSLAQGLSTMAEPLGPGSALNGLIIGADLGILA